MVSKDLVTAVEECAQDLYGQRIAYEYEALNGVVAGGTRISAKNLKQKNRSLLDTLDKAAGFRSIIRLQADDYMQAHAHVFVGYMMAKMGNLDEGLNHLNAAKKIMDIYPDQKNLAIWRNTTELEQKTIKGLINSSIKEWTALNSDSSKYSGGWWERLKYYNQSIGGQSNPSIQDMAEIINDRYFARAWWQAVIGGISLYMAGRYGKRLKLAKAYHVSSEKETED